MSKNIVSYMYVWIYENGAKEFDPYHPENTEIAVRDGHQS